MTSSHLTISMEQGRQCIGLPKVDGHLAVTVATLLPMSRSVVDNRLHVPMTTNIGSGQEVCFGPSRPDPGRNAREQDGTRMGRDGPHLGTWMGPKYCKTKHMTNLDGTPSDPGWDLDGPRIGPRRGLYGTPRDSNRLLGLSENNGD